METSSCRSCGKPMLWARTAATGSLIPLDPDPVPDGNLILADGLASAYVLDTTLFETPPPPAPPGKRYKSHFATCPFAGKHLKKEGQTRK